MNNKLSIFLVLMLAGSVSLAFEMGSPIQLRLKSPSGTYPSENNISVRLQVLSPGACVLHDETFSGQNIVDGNLSVNLGSGSPAALSPGLNLKQVYDNSSQKDGLSCVDSSGNVVSSGQSYLPSQNDHRILRFMTTISSNPILADFEQRSVPYAIHASSIGGKQGADLLTQNASTQLNQANLEALLANTTQFNNLMNAALGGGTVVSVGASSPLSSTGGTAPVISISQANASSSGYLSSSDWSAFNSKQNALGFTPLNPANNLSDIASVATTRSNLGLGSSSLLNVGTTAGTVAAGDDSRITGALQQSLFNSYVASAQCTNIETLYWNSVTGNFLCQSIGTVANATNAATAGTATYFTGSLSGDVSGTQGAVSVDKIRGVPLGSATPSAGDALVFDGSQWVATKGFPKFIKKSADQTFSATGQANVDDLLFTVTAGVTYKFRFTVFYTSAATTNGLRLGLTYPAMTQSSAIAHIPGSTTDGAGFIYSGFISTSGDSVMSSNTPSVSGNANVMAHIEGMFIPSASGTVQLRAATEGAGINIVIKANSFIELSEIP